jgi:hypothetical protein
MNAMVAAATSVRPSSRCGRASALGGLMNESRLPSTTTVATGMSASARAAASATAPPTTATSEAGSIFRRPGTSGFHKKISVTAGMPSAAAFMCLAPSGPNAVASVPPTASICLRPVPSAFRSNSLWNCPTRMMTPMPVSIPWMTAGETARNHCPSPRAPAATCISPAIATAHDTTAKPVAAPWASACPR